MFYTITLKEMILYIINNIVYNIISYITNISSLYYT